MAAVAVADAVDSWQIVDDLCNAADGGSSECFRYFRHCGGAALNGYDGNQFSRRMTPDRRFDVDFD